LKLHVFYSYIYLGGIHHLLDNGRLVPKTLFKVKGYRKLPLCQGVLLTAIEPLGTVTTWIADKERPPCDIKDEQQNQTEDHFPQGCLHYSDLFAIKFEDGLADRYCCQLGSIPNISPEEFRSYTSQLGSRSLSP